MVTETYHPSIICDVYPIKGQRGAVANPSSYYYCSFIFLLFHLDHALFW